MSDAAKRAAAAAALDLVQPGMALGLGTGSTAAWFVRLLGDAMRGGRLRDVRGAATSAATATLAAAEGVPLFGVDDGVAIDLAVDGADEVGPGLALIKGGGAALLREKIVAAAAARFVVIADAGKVVPRLGRFPLPLEIEPFGAQTTLGLVRRLTGAPCALRTDGDGALVRSDGGHLIADASLGVIEDPPRLAAALDALPGVLGHGLFLDMADLVLIGHADGRVERLGRP